MRYALSNKWSLTAVVLAIDSIHDERRERNRRGAGGFGGFGGMIGGSLS